MNKATPWIVLLVIVLGLSAWFFYRNETPEQHPSVVKLPTASTPVPAIPQVSYPVEEIPQLEELPPEPIPALEDSDSAMVEALAAVVGAEALGHYFVLEQIISRVVATIDSLDSRQVAPLVMPVQPVQGKFLVSDIDVLSIHPDNAQRYSGLVQIANVTESDRIVSLYLRYYPLFQEAYEQLGSGDAYFNDRLVEVIDHLLATPQAQGELKLIKPEAVFLFEDPELEALSAGQKLLLRVGPSNAAIIASKLREIRLGVTRQDFEREH